MYLLDSNAWIALLRRRSARLEAELKRRPSSEVRLCSVVLAELWYGVHRSASSHRAGNATLIEQLQATYVFLPFDDSAAVDAAEMRQQLATTGQPIGTHDPMIAAIARVHQLILVTHNTIEFARVPQLTIEDWQAGP